MQNLGVFLEKMITINDIRSILKQEQIDTFILEEIDEESFELFFVKRKLDTSRYNETTKFILTIFLENKKTYETNKIVCKITPDMERNDIAAKIKDIKTVKISNGSTFIVPEKNTYKKKIENIDLKLEASNVADIFLSFKDETTFINSFEIFSTKTTKHIINSNKSDIYFEYFKINGEYTTQSVFKNDVEMTSEFYFYDNDFSKLKDDIYEKLSTTYKKSSAVRVLNTCCINVLINKDILHDVFPYKKKF